MASDQPLSGDSDTQEHTRGPVLLAPSPDMFQSSSPSVYGATDASSPSAYGQSDSDTQGFGEGHNMIYGCWSFLSPM